MFISKKMILLSCIFILFIFSCKKNQVTRNNEKFYIKSISSDRNDNLYKFYYDSLNQLVEISFSTIDIVGNSFFYNQQGQLIKHIRSISGVTSGERVTSLISYTENNNIESLVQIKMVSSYEYYAVDTTLVTFNHNLENNASICTLFNAKKEITIIDSIFYNPQGRVKAIFRKKEGGFILIREIEYNEHSNPVKITLLSNNEYSDYYYKYDDKVNPYSVFGDLKTIALYWLPDFQIRSESEISDYELFHSENNIISNRFYYNYNEFGYPTRQEYFEANGEIFYFTYE